MITHRSSSITLRNGRRLLSAVGLLAALALTACGSSGTSAGSTQPATSASASSSPASNSANSSAPNSAADTIVINNFAFRPSSMTVKPGATVTVHNTDSTTHTLTEKASPRLFNTGDISPGQTKTFKAPTKPGRYPYFCTIHQFMTGTLIVS
jgi:plastocyanin